MKAWTTPKEGNAMKSAIRNLLPLLLALGLLCACGKAPASGPTPTQAPAAPAATPAPTPKPTPNSTPTPEPTPPTDASGTYLLSERGEAVLDEPWFAEARRAEGNARVFYEIFVGSFSDSDGDGTGDLRGILEDPAEIFLRRLPSGAGKHDHLPGLFAPRADLPSEEGVLRKQRPRPQEPLAGLRHGRHPIIQILPGPLRKFHGKHTVAACKLQRHVRRKSDVCHMPFLPFFDPHSRSAGSSPSSVSESPSVSQALLFLRPYCF